MRWEECEVGDLAVHCLGHVHVLIGRRSETRGIWLATRTPLEENVGVLDGTEVEPEWCVIRDGERIA